MGVANMKIVLLTYLTVIPGFVSLLWETTYKPLTCKQSWHPTRFGMHVPDTRSDYKMVIDCSWANFTAIPSAAELGYSERMPNTELDLSNNKIKECPAFTFRKQQFLIKLDLHSNVITYIDVNCFKDLGLLQYLDLRFNKIQALQQMHMQTLQHLYSLQELYISTNCTQGPLPGRLFEPLINLEVFSVTGLGLVPFPQEFGLLQNLHEIYWVYDECSLKPESVLSGRLFQHLNMKNINTLSVVGHHPLRKPLNMSEDLFQYLPNVKKFNLGCTYIGLNKVLNFLKSSSSNNFTHLVLDYLGAKSGLTHSTITDSAFCSYGSTLEMLSLRENNIKEISNQAWKCLPNLKYVAVDRNAPYVDITRLATTQLSLLPPSVETVDASHFLNDTSSLGPALTCLSISHKRRFQNWIDEVPKLPEPETHSLNSNEDRKTFRQQCRSQPGALCLRLPKALKHVFAEHIKFKMEWLSFMSNTPIMVNLDNNVRLLNVSSSGPVDYWFHPVRGLNKLQILDIDDAGFKEIKPNMFLHFPNLRVLILSNNKLGRNGGDLKHLFQGSKNLIRLDISGNSLNQLNGALLVDCANMIVFQADNNGFMEFDLDLANNTNLRMISLVGNALTHLSKRVTHTLDKLLSGLSELHFQQEYLDLLDAPKDNIAIDLRGNNLKCDCDTLGFVEWVQTTKILLIGLHDLKCRDTNLKIMEINLSILQDNCNSSVLVSIGIVGSIFALCVICLVLWYKFRSNILIN